VAQLLVRGLEDDVAAGVRQLAVVNKRSAEEEHRAILRAHVRDNLTGPKKRSFTDVLASMPYFADDPDDLFEV
jgi:plasmid stability protein